MATVSEAKSLALCALGIMALKQLPWDVDNNPPHYWISKYVETSLKVNKQIIDSTPSRPTGLTNFSWPFMKMFCEGIRAFNLIEGPIVNALGLIEKTLRGDFSSTVRLAKQNLQSLKDHNVVYQEKLDKLEPIARAMVDIIALSETLSETTSKESERHTTAIAALEKEIEDITHARKEIDLAKVREAAEKVALYIQTTLNQPDFVKKLTIIDKRLTKIQEALTEATAQLQEAEKSHTQKLDQLSSLMKEYEDLGRQREESLKIYQSQAQRVVEKFTPKQETSYELTITVSNN